MRLSWISPLRLWIKLGDTIQLNGSETGYKIVGLTQGNKFFTEPVVFTSFDDLLDLTRNLESQSFHLCLGFEK